MQLVNRRLQKEGWETIPGIKCPSCRSRVSKWSNKGLRQCRCGIRYSLEEVRIEENIKYIFSTFVQVLAIRIYNEINE